MALITGSRGLVAFTAVLVLVTFQFTGASAVGVNYGTVANNLPTPAQVVSLIQTTYISQVKIYDTNPAVITAFANTGISLVVGARNDEISALAASESFAQQWVSQNVASHYPATNIIVIVVGNEVLTTAQNFSYNLLPAMQNLYTGLTNLGLSGKIKVSTPHSLAVLDKSYPPSDGIFRADLSGPIFSPMLNFLAQTGAPFMVNVYPYFAYRDNPKISISYALFEPNSAVVDSVTGLSYSNLFDAQVDAAYAAMAKLGHQDIKVTVSETGWPSFGDSNEVGVSITNAQMYVSNLLRHINSNSGTPNRPGVAPDTYIFALFNENSKPGPSSERNFGLFLPDKSVVYNVGLVTKDTNTSSPPPVVTTNPPPLTVSSPPSSPPPPAIPSPPSSPAPPLTSTPSPPSTIATPAPPFTAPPPPYPVPHIPPTAGSTPPVVSTSPPPASLSPPLSPPPASLPLPASSPPPPSTATAPPPPSFFNPPPGSSSPPPASGTPPYLPSPPPPPSATSPPPPATTPVTGSPPPPSLPTPVTGSPPPPSLPTPVTGSPPPPSLPTPVTGSPPPPSLPTPVTGSPPPPSLPTPVTGSPPPPSLPTPVTGSPPPPSLPTPVPGSPPPPSLPTPVTGSPPPPTVPTPVTGAPPGTPPAPPGTASGPNTWCVAKPGSAMADLANALNYACGEGGADCSQIQPAGSCFNPNTLFSHASYAFDNYYAKNGRNYWNCFFGNSSLITITNPSYAGCVYV